MRRKRQRILSIRIVELHACLDHLLESRVIHIPKVTRDNGRWLKLASGILAAVTAQLNLSVEEFVNKLRLVAKARA